jgi:thiol-disulfide isomerase/thioredoxin
MTLSSSQNLRQRARQHGAVVAVALFLAASCGGESTDPPKSQSSDARSTTPNISVATRQPTSVLVGGIARIDSVLTANKGRWILVNVWATWCRPCVVETPELVALHQSLQGKPFALVGVSADYMTSPTEAEALRKVRAFGAQHQIPYPTVIFSGSTDDLTARFALSGTIPATILYTPQGQEVERWVGRLAQEDFSRIKALVF